MNQPNSIELSYIVNRLSWISIVYRSMTLLTFLITFLLAYFFLSYLPVIASIVICITSYLSDVYYLKCERKMRRVGGYTTPALSFGRVLLTPVILLFYVPIILLDAAIIIWSLY